MESGRQWRSFRHHWGRCKRRTRWYGKPFIKYSRLTVCSVRGQNENWATARREEDVSEPRSIVNRVRRNFNFWFILKCMLLFARVFPFQFLKLTRLNYRSRATVKQRVRWGWLAYTTTTIRYICTFVVLCSVTPPFLSLHSCLCRALRVVL